MNDRSERMIGESGTFLEAVEHISLAAPLNKPILIIGERGTGKELAAERLHFLSERWGQPYLTLNCATLSDSLLDSELFGHEAGSFSGANKLHKGYFERADSGTLFLDELATTSTRVQEKILRLIEYGELTRLGGNKTVNVDVRLIAATHGDLPLLVQQNKFRADLLDRLSFDVINLPALRNRQEDIGLLAEHFAIKMVKELKRDYFPGFSKAATKLMQDYEWPGNIRELKNVVERSIYRQTEPDHPISTIVFNPFKSSLSNTNGNPDNTAGSETSSLAHTEHNLESKNTEPPLNQVSALTLWKNYTNSSIEFKPYIESLEKELLKQGLKHSKFNQRKAAQQLGLTYDQLRGYIRKYKLNNTK